MNCKNCKNYEPKEVETWEPGDGFRYEKTWREDFSFLCQVSGNYCCNCPIKDQCQGGTKYAWARIGPVEPLIVKSGGTWVKKEGGKNHFWNSDIYEPGQGEEEFYETDLAFWIPFPETLTDEHAKLRPMVFRWDDDRDISTKIGELVAVTSGEKYPYVVRFEPQQRRVYSWKQARLATPEELQEAGK